MPIYEYKCKLNNNHITEILMNNYNPPTEINCKFCNGIANKIFSKPNVIYRGAGFYANDSRGHTNLDD